LRGTYRIRPVDKVVVKGKKEPVGIYEVLDYHTEQTFPNMSKVLNFYQEGLDLYREGRFAGAIDAFTEALSLHPRDRLFALYLDRCRKLIEQPPTERWTGVWVLTEK
jgi:adenylate cyclase